jgi:secreted trypsin-like serine protease
MKVIVVLVLVVYTAAIQPPSTYIVGGSDADANEWPWQAGWLSNGGFSCGCTIIHTNWIITAGHCVGAAVSTYSVEVGHISRGEGTRISVTSVVRHPAYDSGYGGDGYTANDVAVSYCLC